MTALVALTGGIASGKSSAARRFESLGIRVTDADDVAAEVLSRGSPVLDAIRETFGAGALTAHGDYNRKAMRELVFGDERAREQLNAIVHPAVRELTQRKLSQPCDMPYQIWSIPLLLETQQQSVPDRIVVVDVPEDIQIERVMARDGVSETSARHALAAQTGRHERLAVADYVIHNDSSVEALTSQVDFLHQRLMEELS